MASGKKIAGKVIVLVISIVVFLGLSIWMYIGFQEEPPFPGIPYSQFIAFIPLVISVVLVFKTFSLIKSHLKERNLGKPKKGWSFKTGIFAIVFLFAWAPFVLPFFDHGENTKHFSVYNKTWSGASKFKSYLISEGGFDSDNVRTVQASLSSLTRLNGSKDVLLILGPNRMYNPVSEIPFFWQFFKNNGSVLICHDHGSTQLLLLESALVSMGATPFAIFADGVLCDNKTYYKQNDFPVINNLNPEHPITEGLSQIVLSRAGGIVDPSFMDVDFQITGQGFDAIELSPEQEGDIDEAVEQDLLESQSYFAALGFDILGTSSYSYAWIDVDGDGVYDEDKDVYKIPSQFVEIINQKLEEAVEAAARSAIENILSENAPEGQEITLEDYNLTMDDFDIDFDFEMRSNISLGGYPQTVFAAKETVMGNNSVTRTVFCTDASMFNNELIDLEGYDNREFGIRLVQWLAKDDPEARIVFDELHLDPEVAGYRMRGFTSAEIFGLLIGYVNWLSTNPFLSWIYPFLAIYTLRKWLPKSKRKLRKEREQVEKTHAEEKEELQLEFRTKSFFARKITWYRENKKYREALTLLFRRVQRQINARLEGKEYTVDNVLKLVRSRLRPDISGKDYSRLKDFLTRMDKIRKKRGEKIEEDDEFKDLFYEMIWASEIFEKQ